MPEVFKLTAAQGDVYLRKIDALPQNLIEEKCEGNEIVVTHSETGHHHVLDRKKAVMFMADGRTSGGFTGYLDVKEPADLIHKRNHDTHGTIRLEKGFYEIRRQREYVAGAFRRAID